MSAVFEWHERGDSLVVTALPGSLLRIGVQTDARQGSAVELPERARREFVEALGGDDHTECAPADELAEVENERDELRRKVAGLEQDIERMRLAARTGALS